ncbi:FKBP-type peptidyl-prolyl cis-trans isomerase [Dactylosporangium cerinum]|uniref:FKBP-type peptidyl-prolyl cis-trans isomerase n=1 Tax=Dactylosporangium cerinum TaxID=1434730 RepID=A0ABV9VU67_9ACTN
MTVLVQELCAAVTPGQTVTADHVIATLRDGKVFDSSWSRRSTLEAVVGLAQLGRTIEVMEGLDRGRSQVEPTGGELVDSRVRVLRGCRPRPKNACRMPSRPIDSSTPFALTVNHIDV